MIVASLDEYSRAYSNYRHHEGYAKRARLLHSLPEPIIVVGAGFGYLVVELEKLNKNALGLDASPYCYENRATESFIQWDILLGPPRIRAATVITEDLLPWLTDSESITCAKNCALLSPLVLHLVTEQGQADYNYHSTGYWMSLTGQLTISLEGM